jgi:CRISPR-associated protein Cas1
MKRLVVDGYGKFVGRRKNQIVVKEDGKIKDYVVAEDLRQVVISGGGAISFDAMELLGECGVDLVIIDWKGRVKSRLASSMMRTVQTRREQYYAYRDYRGCHLAKQFVYAKLKNQYAVLGTLAKTRKDVASSVADKLIQKRNVISYQLRMVERILGEEISHVREKLMGLEGISSKCYWEGVGEVMPKEFGFAGRSGRYAKDALNSMLNYGYGLLEGEVWRAIHFAGLDPYGGFLHVDRPGKPSMVLDLMEEFRQQIVDKIVIRMVTKGMVSSEGFELKGDVCKMSDAVRRTLLRLILGKFEDYLRYKGVKLRWADLILSQARNIAKYLRGEIERYECFYLRW